MAQARARVTPEETAFGLEMQLTALGTELMLEIVSRMAAGWIPEPHGQDLSQGYVTASWQWSEHLERQARYLERTGKITEMLHKPARRTRLPIVILPN